jgi:hypothetical protein
MRNTSWFTEKATEPRKGLCLTFRESSSIYEKRLSADHLEQPIDKRILQELLEKYERLETRYIQDL